MIFTVSCQPLPFSHRQGIENNGLLLAISGKVFLLQQPCSGESQPPPSPAAAIDDQRNSLTFRSPPDTVCRNSCVVHRFSLPSRPAVIGALSPALAQRYRIPFELSFFPQRVQQSFFSSWCSFVLSALCGPVFLSRLCSRTPSLGPLSDLRPGALG